MFQASETGRNVSTINMAIRAYSTHLGPIPLLDYIENPHIYPLKCNGKFGAFKIKNKQQIG